MLGSTAFGFLWFNDLISVMLTFAGLYDFGWIYYFSLRRQQFKFRHERIMHFRSRSSFAKFIFCRPFLSAVFLLSYTTKLMICDQLVILSQEI